MKAHDLDGRIESYLDMLCNQLPNRHVGSPGNWQATEFFAETVERFGFEIEKQMFDCIEWECGNVNLSIGDGPFEAMVSPYSLPFKGSTQLIAVSTIDELEQIVCSDKILQMHGEIVKEKLMPKKFIFYNPDRHKKIYRLLEEKKPAAIIAATGKNPEAAGGVYPFPFFEDGDFDIPSVYMKDVDGSKLLKHVGSSVKLEFESKRIDAKGCNIAARKIGTGSERIVFTAHIDAKKGTPGALDNAAGVSTLLALAELLNDYSGKLTVEIVAFNGEDYYSVPGQMLYLAKNKDDFQGIRLAVNLDGVGCRDSKAAFSFYECDESVSELTRDVIDKQKKIVEGDPWPQGDHMIFVMNGRPALAITSENPAWIAGEIIHTGKDTAELVDSAVLADVAKALKRIIVRLNN